MSEESYRYVIVGGGLAAASAAEGIRERDAEGSVLVMCGERHLPYDRPPLSKKLWLGTKKVEEVFLHDEGFYREHGVEVRTGTRAAAIDAEAKLVRDADGNDYRYEKLLLATGGEPRRLGIPGEDLEGICHYRYLDDYMRVREQAAEGKRAVVVGGGFIGSEMAAALSANKVEVTMVFPDPYLVARVLPEGLGRAVQEQFERRGVRIVRDAPESFGRKGEGLVTRTKGGAEIESDLVVVGIGIAPAVGLAEGAGLEVGNGIAVEAELRTSRPDVWAAGDNAEFPYEALGARMRVEHWDNALNQGKQAGRNMAGAGEPYRYMPYFFSDLFEFGYEAVGDVSTRLETFADWQKENEKGVVYYLKGGKVRGAMMCGVWDKVEAARELIRSGKRVAQEELRGAIG